MVIKTVTAEAGRYPALLNMEGIMPKFLSKDVLDNGHVVFKLGDGFTFVVNPDDLPEAIKYQMLRHGVKQKYGDGTAGFSKDKDFKGAREALESIHEALMAGDWEREGRGGGVSLDDLAEAIARIKKVEVAKARAAVEAASIEKRKEWASNAKVAAGIQEIRLAKAKERAKDEKDEIDIEV